MKQNYTVGIAKYQEVLKKYKINDTTREYGELLQSLAYVYVNLNLYDKAMETYQKGNLIYYKKDLKQAQQDNNDFLHRIYERTEDYNKSLQLDIKSLKTDSAAKDQIDLVYDYTSIGSDYLNLKNYPKALIYAKKASALNDMVHTYGSGNADLLQLITEIYYRSHDYANAFPAAKKMLSAQIFNSEVRYQCILLSGMIVRDAPPDVLVNNGISAARRFNEALKNINQASGYE